MKQPLVSMTNLGILDSARLTFGGIRPISAFMSAASKCKPNLQMATSS
ncbi:MAG: hypothetical protein P4L93_00025 [Coriobacteriia bacterium]|nr:hypothetical protein [Coriobacteriia bacterium]